MSKVGTRRSRGEFLRSLVDDIKRGRLTRCEALLRGGALGLSMQAILALGSTGSGGLIEESA